MSAKVNFKKSYSAVRKEARSYKGELMGVGFDGRLHIADGFAYDACFAAKSATCEDGYSPNGDAVAAYAAVKALSHRVYFESHPEIPASERFVSKNSEFDGLHDFL